MTPQESELVDELFNRLAQLETAQRDPEAERLIADGLRRAPHAVYALVQTVLLQDEANSDQPDVGKPGGKCVYEQLKTCGLRQNFTRRGICWAAAPKNAELMSLCAALHLQDNFSGAVIFLFSVISNLLLRTNFPTSKFKSFRRRSSKRSN